VKKRRKQALKVVGFFLLSTIVLIGVLFASLEFYSKILKGRYMIVGSRADGSEDGVNISASVFFNPINQMVSGLKNKESELTDKERIIKQKEDRLERERKVYIISVLIIFFSALTLCWVVIATHCAGFGCAPKRK